MSEKKITKWVGDSVLQTLKAGPLFANVLAIVPVTLDVDDAIGDCTHQTTYLKFHTRRLLTTSCSAAGWIMWSATALSGVGGPVQALDPLSLVSRAWANKDIMGYGPLDVPSTVSNGSTGVVEVDRSVMTLEYVCKAKRKLNRANHEIYLSVNCDVDDVLSTFIQHRSLLHY